MQRGCAGASGRGYYAPGRRGVLHVAVRTDMHNCTGEMFEWWFRWRCDTQKYTWWHPVDHLFSTWQGELSDSTHVGSEHVATEELTGQPATDLLVQFRDPAEFFDPRSYREARDSGKISCAVTARAGLSHSPKRQSDGAVIGGRVLHIGRDTAWGLALRSHFYLGQDLPGKRGVTARSRARSHDGTGYRPAPACVQRVYFSLSFPAVIACSRAPR